MSADLSAPPLPLLLREAAALAELRWKSLIPPKLRMSLRRRDHSVLVIPGFLATDHSTKLLRLRLEAAGYKVHGWGMGVNLGARADTLERLERRLIKAAKFGPVTVIGWSLGGLFARELAKRAPDKVARVITLGTPFSGDMRANNAWRLYELVSRHKVDAPPIDVRLHEKPPVPTTAFWSRRDGIVAPACARGAEGECDDALELACTHMGFMTAPEVADAVLRILKADAPSRLAAAATAGL